MESNPDLGDIQVTETVKNQTTKGTVVEVQKGERQEVYNLEEGEEPKYDGQSRDDPILNLVIETEVDGKEYTVYEDMRFYENPSDRSNFGKFVKRYGVPEAGQEVTVDFDEEGDASVVL